MIPSILIAAALATAPAHEVSFEAPSVHVTGEPFLVEVTVKADGPLEAWRLGPAAFEINGQPLGERGTDTVELPAGAEMTLSFDLSASLPSGSFQLGCAGVDALTDVEAFQAVPRGSVSFLDMSPEELEKYKVLFVTNRGPVVFEMWPKDAPNHVRNFCDLANTGFYEGIQFHRVSPTFMIQGGCPNTKDKPKSTWGQGNGPRQLPAEFSETLKHVPGVLSMARSQSPDSGSSQFFVMTAPNAGLDGKYSIFGKVATGMDTVMRIARAPGSPFMGATMPSAPQRIERTYVLKPE